MHGRRDPGDPVFRSLGQVHQTSISPSTDIGPQPQGYDSGAFGRENANPVVGFCPRVVTTELAAGLYNIL
jgi:hypothetical protein